MTSNLFGRALGTVSPRALQQAETSRLLHSLQAAPEISVDGSDGSVLQQESENADEEGQMQGIWAHRAGVNCLTIDRFEGR
jgi:hypothetical protein